MVEKTEAVSVRLPREIVKALALAIKKGKALNESDYLRDAIRKKLREDGLL